MGARWFTSKQGPRPHGRTKYQAEGCRCEVCRADNASRELLRRYQEPKPVEGLPKGTRRCKGCGLVIAVYAFTRRGRCRPCSAAYLREWRKANPDRRRNWRERYHSDPVFRAKEIERAKANRRRRADDRFFDEEAA